LVAGALAGGLLALGAQSADAIIAQVSPGKDVSYQPLRGAPAPLDAFFSNLDYNGGPVMPSNTNYAFYWDPSGAPAYPASYQEGIDRYLEDLAGDSGGTQNVDSVSAQYNDAAGRFASYQSHFGGEIIDTDPYPPNGCTRAAICITDAQLQAELAKYTAEHELPRDLEHEYFMLTPPEVESCFNASGAICSAGSSKPVYCAYHGNDAIGGEELIYADDPYVTGIFGCDDGNHPNGPSDGALEGGLSHEHNESITDPEPNNAWTDIGGSGGEIGDKCEESMGATLGSAPDGASYNQVVHGDLYWYQEEWSNQGAGCLQRLAFSGAEPTATYTTTAAGGNVVSFDASASTAPGGVARYNWQFNDGPGGSLSTPTETTSPKVAHTFPAAGFYTVALTVYPADGTSIGTARTVTAGNPPVPSVTKLSPAKGAAGGGTSVKIIGAGFAGATAVHFGSRSASFTISSSSTIIATVPAAAVETVDVTVTNAIGTSALVSADHYKYIPAVTGVSPAAGAAAGGATVTVTGSGFLPGSSATIFKFGTTKAASVSCSSSTTCTVLTPAHAAGTVDVKATVNALASAKTVGDRFTFT
jgi:hypothetical protein